MTNDLRLVVYGLQLTDNGLWIMSYDLRLTIYEYFGMFPKLREVLILVENLFLCPADETQHSTERLVLLLFLAPGMELYDHLFWWGKGGGGVIKTIECIYPY